jgi:hypothetical protein
MPKLGWFIFGKSLFLEGGFLGAGFFDFLGER